MATIRITAEQLHQVVQAAIDALPPALKQIVGENPDWGNLKPEERAEMEKAAKELNMVIGELVVDNAPAS